MRSAMLELDQWRVYAPAFTNLRDRRDTCIVLCGSKRLCHFPRLGAELLWALGGWPCVMIPRQIQIKHIVTTWVTRWSWKWKNHCFHSPDCVWVGTFPWNHWKCRRTIFWQCTAAAFAAFGPETTLTNSQLMGPIVDSVWRMMEVEPTGELLSGVLFSTSTVVYRKEWDCIKIIW